MPYSVPFITLAIAAYQRYQYYKMYMYIVYPIGQTLSVQGTLGQASKNNNI